MRRGARVGLAVAAVAVAAAGVTVIALGVVGVGQTVSAGGQTQICGVSVGVSVSEQSVRLLGVSDEPLVPGDRVRLSALCVVEVVDIRTDDGGADDDGGGAWVDLRWRLW